MRPATRVVHEITDKTRVNNPANLVRRIQAEAGTLLREARTAGTTTSKVGAQERIEAH